MLNSSSNWKHLTELCKADPGLKDKIFNQALQRRPHLNFKSVVVAGSNGKTTVKELIAHVLKNTNLNFFSTPQNHNTKIAIATQIIQMPIDLEWAVFEVGARKVNDFQIPLQLIHPEIALLLNIGTAHVGEFGSINDLRNEKLSILKFKNLKAAVFNGDDPLILRSLAYSTVEKISFGYEPQNDVAIIAENKIAVKYKIFNKIYEIKNDALFAQRAINIAAALATCLAMKIPIETALAGISSFKGVDRRFSKHAYLHTDIIDDAFNASPESVVAGLKLFSEVYENKKSLLILGDMAELGDLSQREHRKIGEHISALFRSQISRNHLGLVLIGTEAREIAHSLNLHKSCVKFYQFTADYLTDFENDIVNFDAAYLKASKTMQFSLLLDHVS